MRRRSQLVPTLLLPLLLVGPAIGAPSPSAEAVTHPDVVQLSSLQKRILSGSTQLALDEAGAVTKEPNDPAEVFEATAAAASSSTCRQRFGSNIAVNQNCANVTPANSTTRGQVQTEPALAVDPGNPRSMVAAYNDYRRGDTTCGVSYTRDGGRHWTDATAPTGFVDGRFVGASSEYFHFGGDPSVAWDSRGNAYLSCLMGQRGPAASANQDASSGIYVYRSTGTGGASWNFPGRTVAQIKDLKGYGIPLLDKPLMAVDAVATSRFRDRVYVAYTRFGTDLTAHIFLSYSKDYGQTFSRPVLVSRDSPLCPNTQGLPAKPSRCTSNSYAQPFTAPDGTLYVTWANYNTPTSGGRPEEEEPSAENRAAASKAPKAGTPRKVPKDNRNQILLARSTDGGATFSNPVKVGAFYDIPECSEFLGEPGACMPEKGITNNSRFSMNNYPSGAVNPRTGEVTVAFGSYINRFSNEKNHCVPTGFTEAWPTYTGVKAFGACNNDILVSTSTNRGASFTGTTTDPRRLATLTAAARQRSTDQFTQWIGFTRNGTLAVSYYDRQYGDSERTGSLDISVTSGRRPAALTVRRVTTSSMPPPTQFGGRGLGDYAGLAISGNDAFPVWADTRSPAPVLCPGTGTVGQPPRTCRARLKNGIANDQQIFTARVPLG